MLVLLSRVVLEQATVESIRSPASAPIRSTVAELMRLSPSCEVVDRYALVIPPAPPGATTARLSARNRKCTAKDGVITERHGPGLEPTTQRFTAPRPEAEVGSRARSGLPV